MKRNPVTGGILFGAQFLLTHFEPVRIHLAATGELMTAITVIVRWRRFRACNAGYIPAAHANPLAAGAQGMSVTTVLQVP